MPARGASPLAPAPLPGAAAAAATAALDLPLPCLASLALGVPRGRARRSAGARRGGLAGRPAVNVLDGAPAPTTSVKVREDVGVDRAAERAVLEEDVFLFTADDGSQDLVCPGGDRHVTAVKPQLIGVPLLSEEELADCQPRRAWGRTPGRQGLGAADAARGAGAGVRGRAQGAPQPPPCLCTGCSGRRGRRSR